ncbi:T9SS type A sorting domain-containing protein [Apibacter sp. HY039]|uniref:T9SS type A sorting domain-containing protein n=1 Tax=Apibacter sp. HY039 TaxID=2501476 RepID=UPI000FEB961B|nr:T9SS type A sorting domain-containing protein [Apibacter sp. HY039]
MKDSEGNISIIERVPGTFIVDKLPINITGNSIWNKNLSSSELQLSSHLQLKTNQDNRYAVTQESTFMVFALQPSTDTRIGLFSLNGTLMEDVTVSRKKNTFICKVSANIPSANYILAPFENKNQIVKIIERPSGKSIIDKIPLFVNESDIWNLKNMEAQKTTEGNLTLFPNPVTDLLSLKISEKRFFIEIYSSTGEFIKKIENKKEINTQDLIPGLYIIKIITDNNEYIRKIIKK